MISRSVSLGVAALLLSTSLSFGQSFSKDAKFTILLMSVREPDHIARAKQYADYFRKQAGLKDLMVVHSEAESSLYYGGYKAVDASEDADEARRFRNDLAKMQTLVVEGQQPFQGAIAFLSPTPNPEAPPEWNIVNAQGKYSLEIAIFKQFADRKQLAVDFVKELRKQNVPAYFYHGPSSSSVLVGCFGADAITFVDADTKAEPGKEIVVVPVKPAGMADEVQQADGTTSKVVAPSIRISDPMLLALLKREEFQQHWVDGSVGRIVTDARTGKTEKIISQSIIVDLSKIKSDILNAHVKAQPAPSPDIVIPQAGTPGSGKLKKVGG